MVKAFCKIQVNPKRVQDAIARVKQSAPITKAEKGNLCADMYQLDDDPTIFMFDEEWETLEDMQAHMNSEICKEMGAFWDEVCEGDYEFYTLTQVV